MRNSVGRATGLVLWRRRERPARLNRRRPRAISRTESFCTKCARLIRPTVSTVVILRPVASYKADDFR
jgi:hypothetical protein